jgi:hypothetical protein
MSDRLTVVLDDPELYRRLKVFAARRSQTLKRTIEDALREHLQFYEGPTLLEDEPAKGPTDWEGFFRRQQEFLADLEARDERPEGADAEEGSTKSPVGLAEERGAYDDS